MDKSREDRRTVYSKRFIRESLFDLMKDKPLNKISVKEICEKADVNRSTFYSYYTDIYDLYQKIIDEFFEKQQDVITYTKLYLESRPSMLTLTVKDYYEFVSYYTKIIRDNRELYKFAFNQNSNNSIHLIFGKTFFEALENVLSASLPEELKPTFRFCYSFVSGGTTAIIMAWLSKDCSDPIELISKQLSYFYYDIFSSHKYKTTAQNN